LNGFFFSNKAHSSTLQSRQKMGWFMCDGGVIFWLLAPY